MVARRTTQHHSTKSRHECVDEPAIPGNEMRVIVVTADCRVVDVNFVAHVETAVAAPVHCAVQSAFGLEYYASSELRRSAWIPEQSTTPRGQW